GRGVYRRSTTKAGILLHQNRDSPTPKPGFSYIKTGGPSRTVGAPAPGAKVFWFDSLSHRGRGSYTQTGFAPGAVLLHPNRVRTGGGAPTSKPELSPHRRSTRAGCEGLWTGAPGVSRRAVLRPDNRIH